MAKAVVAMVEAGAAVRAVATAGPAAMAAITVAVRAITSMAAVGPARPRPHACPRPSVAATPAAGGMPLATAIWTTKFRSKSGRPKNGPYQPASGLKQNRAEAGSRDKHRHRPGLWFCGLYAQTVAIRP